MPDIYLDSVYLQIKSPFKKRFPFSFTLKCLKSSLFEDTLHSHRDAHSVGLTAHRQALGSFVGWKWVGLGQKSLVPGG